MALGRRLAELGLRPGTVVTVLRRTAGGGRVVAVGAARVALGREMLRALAVSAAA
jgi:ferrous iron transport protein A